MAADSQNRLSDPYRRALERANFLAPDNSIMAAEIAIDHTRGAVAGVPQRMVSIDFTPGGNRPSAVTKDGQRFLLPRPLPSPPLTVVLNWPTMLGR